MPYAPHLRVTCSGTIDGGEIFSFGFALSKTTENAPDYSSLSPNDTVWTDLKNDCVAYFGRAATGIHPRARLLLVKIAPIGANGLYSGAPVEKQCDQRGAGTNSGVIYPNQVSRAVTLHTAGDLGRVKGRWYLPCPTQNTSDGSGVMPANEVEAAEASDVQFINAVNNQPGLDVLDLSIHVASQGRSRNGVQVLGPKNYEVNGVSVGRVLDTIRSRRKAIAELRTVTAVS